MSGVSIGNGSIVAAFSHVVKDVEPYSIVGGNPAREIRKRFNREFIEELEKIRWWDWPFEEVMKRRGELTSVDTELFAQNYGINTGI